MEYIKNWDEFFFLHVYLAARKSKDDSTKIAAVLTRNRIILSEGYNGMPRGVDDSIKERYERPLKYFLWEHAERNCLYNAARNGINTSDSIMYTNSLPCSDCTRGIIQCNVSKVILHKQHQEIFDGLRGNVWKENCNKSIDMLKEAGVEIEYFDKFLNLDCLINGKVIKV